MKITGTILFLFISAAYTAFPDTLYLLNGDRISGDIVSMTESEVKIQTEFGLINVDRKKIVYGSFGDESKADRAGSDKSAEKNSEIKTGSGKAAEKALPLIFFPFSGTVTNAGNAELSIKENTVKSFSSDEANKQNEAVSLKGGGEYFITSAPEELKSADEFTFRIMHKMYNPLKLQYLASMWESSSGTGVVGKFALCVKMSNLVLYLADSKGAFHEYGVKSVLTPLAWNDLVVSVGLKKIRIYVNGKLAHEASREFKHLQKPDIPLCFFSAVGGQDGKDYKIYNMEGCVSEISIWDRALSPEQIEAAE